MRWNMVVLASCLMTAGCVGGTSMAERQDEAVQSSLQYDDLPCDQLVTQRNQVAQQLNLLCVTRCKVGMAAFGSRYLMLAAVPEEHRLSQPRAGRNQRDVARSGETALTKHHHFLRIKHRDAISRGLKIVEQNHSIGVERLS